VTIDDDDDDDNNNNNNNNAGPISSAACGVGVDILKAVTVGSNAAKGMDVCPRLFIIISIIHVSPYNRRYIG
jgi:hypothetical protein